MDNLKLDGYKIIKIQNDFLSVIPTTPGVYLYLDENKKILYIGKAKNLKARISSYFVDNNQFPKTRQMLKHAKYIKIINTISEFDAFLLEAQLIKLFKPKYNIQLKDDKSYPYIALQKVYIKENTAQKSDGDKKKYKYYYKLFLTRNLKLKDTVYFGPYPDVGQVRNALRLIRRVFPVPNCSKTKFLEHNKKGRPCLYGQIGLCPAPCVNKDGFKQANLNAKRVMNLFKYGHLGYLDKLNKRMLKLAKQEKFERAITLRNVINALNNLATRSIIKTDYLQNPQLTQDVYIKRVEEISNTFGGIYKLRLRHKLFADICKQDVNVGDNTNKVNSNVNKNLIFRIEAYDMSTFMLRDSTASMVVAKNGKIEKSEFKRFKIKIAGNMSDFDMFKEVFLRRLKHCDWQIPDMLLLDGGKAQVSSVIKVLYSLVFNLQNQKNKLNKEDIIKMRKIKLNEIKWRDLPKNTNNLPYLFLTIIPIWGIYKPFDNFVAYIPQLRLSIGKEFNNYLQNLQLYTHLSIQQKDNWLFLLPKQRTLGIQFLRELRDHAHDFAKGYHKFLRDKIS